MKKLAFIFAFVFGFATANPALAAFQKALYNTSDKTPIAHLVMAPAPASGAFVAPRLDAHPDSMLKLVQDAPTPPSLALPEADLGKILLQLLTNWKTLGPLGIGMLVVLALTQLLKLVKLPSAWNRLTVTVLSVAYSVLLGLSQNMSLGAILVATLLTAGGAVALYEAIKGVIRLKVPKKA